MRNPKVYILSGIPCSAKSSWAQAQGLTVISCDGIRLENFSTNSKYTFSYKNEDKVWSIFYKRLKIYECTDFIIDNTNCKEAYIDKIIQELNPNYEIYIKRFPISLTKAYYRNIIRYFRIKKWIPFKVIRNMKKNYKQINWKKYEQYLLYI